MSSMNFRVLKSPTLQAINTEILKILENLDKPKVVHDVCYRFHGKH